MKARISIPFTLLSKRQFVSFGNIQEDLRIDLSERLDDFQHVMLRVTVVTPVPEYSIETIVRKVIDV